MKVLFLESHPMWIHGLPNGFRDLGHDVMVSGELTKENIPIMISEFNPDLMVGMGWTRETTGNRVYWVRKFIKQSKAPYIYWATEDPSYTHCFTLPLIQTLLPQFVFTINEERVNYYKKLGFKSAHLIFGFHEKVHYRMEPDEKYKCKIAVVANGYPDYIKEHPDCPREKSLKTLVTPLLKSGFQIDFWGRYWDQMSPIVEFDIPPQWIHGYLPYTDANKVYSSADIIIGIQNSQLTQRTYEVLASEGFLITNNSEPIRKQFEHGKGLIITSSPEETVELVKYYLDNSEEREKIRKDAKLIVSQCSYTKRAQYMIEVLKEQGVLPCNLK